jgi:hypothetical protein
MRPTPACVTTSSRDQTAFPIYEETNRLAPFWVRRENTSADGGSSGGQNPGGVVGAHAERGWGRNIHLPALQALNDFQVTAVADTTSASARAAAEVWGARKSYDDARALMADPDVDLVTLAVQLPSREGLVEAGIAASRHVCSEWPLAPDAATAERFESAARAAGVRHAVGLQSRHHPEVRLLRSMLAQELIGEVLTASLLYSLATPEVWSTRYAALFDGTKGVNHLAVVGGHSLDMFQYAVGDFTEVSATLATRIDRITMEGTGETIGGTSPDHLRGAPRRRRGSRRVSQAPARLRAPGPAAARADARGGVPRGGPLDRRPLRPTDRRV